MNRVKRKCAGGQPVVDFHGWESVYDIVCGGFRFDVWETDNENTIGITVYTTGEVAKGNERDLIIRFVDDGNNDLEIEDVDVY